MLVNGDITSSQYQQARAQRNLDLKPGRRFTPIREPYFFGYVEDLLQQEYGSNTVREGGLKVYTTIAPGLQRAATAAITHVLDRADRSGVGDRLDRSTHRSDPGDDRSDARSHGQPVQLRHERAAAAGLDLQDDHAHDRGRARAWTRSTTSYLSAPFHYQPDPTCNSADPNCAWDVQTYEHDYAGVESVENATHAVRQHRVRAARARRRSREHRRRWRRSSASDVAPLPRDAVPSITLGTIGVTPLEMASAYATLAAGGVYSKPMAITKVVLPNGKVDTSAGWGKPQRSASSPTGSRPR